METEVLASLTQFGVAGLIGWMWMTERRELELMEEVVRENTRALAAVEAGQRALADAVERLGARLGRRGPGGGEGRAENGGRAA